MNECTRDAGHAGTCNGRKRADCNQRDLPDSGKRLQFESGMVRDTTEGKLNYLLLRSGPMFERWAERLTLGALKYTPDNWLRANSEEELRRAKESAARHFEQWLAGAEDEDHAAAVFFNINEVEYIAARLAERGA